jgi:hypothetical protein
MEKAQRKAKQTAASLAEEKTSLEKSRLDLEAQLESLQMSMTSKKKPHKENETKALKKKKKEMVKNRARGRYLLLG